MAQSTDPDDFMVQAMQRLFPLVDPKEMSGRTREEIQALHLARLLRPPVGKGGRPPDVDPLAVKAELKRRRAAGEDDRLGALAQHFAVSKRTIGRCLKTK